MFDCYHDDKIAIESRDSNNTKINVHLRYIGFTYSCNRIYVKFKKSSRKVWPIKNCGK